METPLLFRNKDYNLFGVLHTPEDTNTLLYRNKLGVIFCHPFAEEKLISHRVLVNLARELTRDGLYCFRFDYMGHGDSEGNFEDSTVETRLSDIQCAVDLLSQKTEVEKIGLIGVRFGATLAALSCLNNTGIEFLVLISPIINGKLYVEQCLRSNLTHQMMIYREIIKDRKQLIRELMAGQKINIDGYLLTKDMYEQMGAIDLMKNSFVAPDKILFVQSSKNEKQPIEAKLNELYMSYRDNNNGTKIINVVEDHFWKDTKYYISYKKGIHKEIFNWLKEIYAS